MAMTLPVLDSGVRIKMMNPTNQLFCRLDGLTPGRREQKRVDTLKDLGLLESESVPVFEEATQTAADFLQTPICFLGLMVQDHVKLKSAVGLSRLGLMNELAATRKIPREEAFCTYVVDSEHPINIEDTYHNPVFASSTLTQHYGIRSYLGTPLITQDGQCIGVLAVLDRVPRQFTQRELQVLTLTARWCMREFERDQLLKTHSSHPNEEWLGLSTPSQTLALDAAQSNYGSQHPNSNLSQSTYLVKLRLLKQLTHELRSPLTAVIGMASVLRGEVFGNLTHKQKEYLEIIHSSGQQMNALVDEVIKLTVTEQSPTQLSLNPVNIEMLCQRALNSLSQIAKQKRLELRLSVEPGKRIWLLDKEKVEQTIYYLVTSVIESSEAGGEIRIHVSRKTKTLNIAVWLSHPWLGGGLPQVHFHPSPLLNSLSLGKEGLDTQHNHGERESQVLTTSGLELALKNANVLQDTSQNIPTQEILGLLLSCNLVESHGGKIVLEGSSESGYRYILMLPKIAADED